MSHLIYLACRLLQAFFLKKLDFFLKLCYNIK